VFAMLLVGAVCITASLASAQRVSSPLPPAGETVQTPGTEAIGPAESVSKVEGTAPPEESQPFRPPSFPKMVLLDIEDVLASPFHWRGREWLLGDGMLGASASLDF
jgi:hypothetical protein